MTWAERTKAKWLSDDQENPALDRWLRQDRHKRLVGFCYRTRWHVFWTQTFRGRHTEDGAQSRWLRYLAGFKWYSSLERVLYTVEPHANIPSHHVHALLSMNCARPLTTWANDWRYLKEEAWKLMGKALILPVVDNEAVSYVLKYVTKLPRNIAWERWTPSPASAQGLWGIVDYPLPKEETQSMLLEREAYEYRKGMPLKGRRDYGQLNVREIPQEYTA